MMKFTNHTEQAFYNYMVPRLKESTANDYIMRIRKVKALDVLIHENIDPYIHLFETGRLKNINVNSHNAYTSALKQFRAFQQHCKAATPQPTSLKDFLGKVVVDPKTKRRYKLDEITAPYIEVVTVEPNARGYHENYCCECNSGDPISNGTLVFEDPTLTEPFKKLYNAYCRTEDAYWENYGYWLHKS